MSEQEMLAEIDRLRRELAEACADRDSLRLTACQVIPRGALALTDQEIAQMQQDAIEVDALLAVRPFDRQLSNGNPAAEMGALQHEVERTRKERFWLHKLVCRTLAIDDPDVIEAELMEQMKEPWYGIEDIIEDLRRHSPDAPPTAQIPA